MRPKFYSLVKAHKTGFSVRSIVSFIGSPTYRLSTYITDILTLSFFQRTDYNIKDSFTFVEKIKHYTLPPGYVLISLDVVSLFTNIPRDLVINIIVREWSSVTHHTDMGERTFVDIIRFLFDSSTFIFADIVSPNFSHTYG